MLQSKNEIESISTAHLSRIENDRARPSDEELYWINIVLGMPLGALLGDEPKSAWFVVRRSPVWSQLDDIKSGRVKNLRHEGAHKEMVEARRYRYVPLELGSALVAPDEKSAAGLELESETRVALLEVERFEEREMEENLSGHTGQEAVFCLDGELEFWQQAEDSKPLRLVLAPGDFIRFDSRQPHGFRARSDDSVRALHIVSNMQKRKPDAAVITKEVDQGE